MDAGYSNWGRASRTNSITDALNRMVTMDYSLAYGSGGIVTQMAAYGPAFAGASPNTNWASVTYSPDKRSPTSIVAREPKPNDRAGQSEWNSTLDDKGNLLTFTNPMNQTSRFYYEDGTGINLTKATDATGISASFEYTAANQPSDRLRRVKDNTGLLRMELNYSTAEYGLLSSVRIPAAANVVNDDSITTFAYVPGTGDLASATDPLGDMVTVDSYDAFGDPLSVTVYPTTGQPTTIAAQRLQSTRVMDAAQRVTDKYAPNGVRTHNVWGDFTQNTLAQDRGRLNAIETYAPGTTTNPLAKMSVTHDVRGRLSTATDLAGLCATYGYDAVSNLISISDGMGRQTQFEYGNNNEPKKILWSDNTFATLQYDGGGRVRQSVDERGVTTNYTYDDAGRLTQMQTLATVNTPAETVTVTYDAAGRVLTVTDGSGSRTFDYEPNRKRLSKVTTVLNGLPAGANTFTLDYVYFPDGSVQSVTSNVAGQWSYEYDKAGQLTKVTNPQGQQTTYGYDHIGRRLSQNTGNGFLVTTLTYGNSGQAGDSSAAPIDLKAMSYEVIGAPYYTLSLVHSYLGQLKKQTIVDRVVASSRTWLTGQYGYDGRGRVATENVSILNEGEGGSGRVLLSDSYIHDLANNVRPSSQAWNVNGNNQVTGSAAGSAGLAGATNLGYDVSGNLSSVDGNTYTWDGLGRLTGIGANISYGYDSAGRRIRKTVNGVSTYYVYAGGAVIAEVNGSGGLVRSYTYGASGLVSDWSASSGSRLYLFDGQGNTFGLVDGASGQMLGVAGFGAWGKAIVSSLPTTPFGWKGQAGQWTDAETGLVYCQRRYYSPKLGRWLSRDPIGFAGGINLYAYCSGDPINYSDPSGLVKSTDRGFRGVRTSPLSFHDPDKLGPPHASFVEYIWAAPASVLGMIGSTGSEVSYDREHDAYNAENAWFAKVLDAGARKFGSKNEAVTLGEYVLWKGKRKDSIYAHELAHIQQHHLLGPFFFLYYASGVLTGLAVGDIHDGNPIEVDADVKAGILDGNDIYNGRNARGWVKWMMDHSGEQ